jgi:prepilin signal peptidase PulO-like enzyme (type II secretory pathway)
MLWILGICGLGAGVLVNLLADSLPTARRVQLPACRGCGQSRPPIAWSGILAFVSGHRRCPRCAALLPYRHLLVELALPLLFVFSGARTGASTTTFLNAFYAALLVLILVTDIEHRLILHAVILPSILLALIGAYVNPAFDDPKRALLGGAVGLLAALCLYFFGALFSWLLGRLRREALPGPALGFGDVTLSTFLGLIVGVPEIIFALVIGMLAGFVGAVILLLVRGAVQRTHRAFATFMPYGPFLVLGGAAMLFFGSEFMAWYAGG